MAVLPVMLAAACGLPGLAQAQTSTLFVPAAIPKNASSVPLPDARAQAITESGMFVDAGDVLTISVSGTASGGWAPSWGFFDANGAPAGSQYTSGPFDSGEFPRVVGPPANIYSLVATIVAPGSTAHLTGVEDEWFFVGTANSIVADRAGELQFAFDDALYRDDWASAYRDNSGGFSITFGVNEGAGDTGGKVTGGGWTTDEKHSFSFNARQGAGTAEPKGQLTYQDKQAGVTIKSSAISQVAISGTRARITGAASVNGAASSFTLVVDDLGEAGTSDTFTIAAGGYSAGGVLRGGNIQIHG